MVHQPARDARNLGGPLRVHTSSYERSAKSCAPMSSKLRAPLLSVQAFSWCDHRQVRLLLDTDSVRRTLRTRHQFSKRSHPGGHTMSVDTTPEATTDARIPHPAWRLPVLGDVLGINIRTPLQNSVSIGREHRPDSSREMSWEIASSSPRARTWWQKLSDESPVREAPCTWSQSTPRNRRRRPVHGVQPRTQLGQGAQSSWHRRSARLPMRSYHRTMLDVAGELVDHWDSRESDSPIDVSADHDQADAGDHRTHWIQLHVRLLRNREEQQSVRQGNGRRTLPFAAHDVPEVEPPSGECSHVAPINVTRSARRTWPRLWTK